MNFFEHQEVARKNTRWLIFLFLFTVIALIVTLNLFALLMITTLGRESIVDPLAWAWSHHIISIVSLGTIVIIALGSWVKIASLSGGGVSVALELGGRPLNPDTKDPQEQRLLNIVEEMAIA